MPFQPGNSGRPRGATNKRTLEIEHITQRLGVNPFETLLLFAKGDWEALGYDSSVIVKESQSGESTFLEYTISPELRAQCAKEACKYLYPTKKSVEHTTVNALEGMTPEEKLQMMKQAVQMLEGELSAIKPADETIILDGSQKNT